MIKKLLTLITIFLLMTLPVLAGNHLNKKPETTGKPEVIGLELALTLVKNEVAKIQLRVNIDSIQNKLEEVKAIVKKDNRTIITGKGTAKFLGLFNIRLTHVFDVDEDGNLVRRNRFIDIFFAKEKEGFE